MAFISNLNRAATRLKLYKRCSERHGRIVTFYKVAWVETGKHHNTKGRAVNIRSLQVTYFVRVKQRGLLIMLAQTGPLGNLAVVSLLISDLQHVWSVLLALVQELRQSQWPPINVTQQDSWTQMQENFKMIDGWVYVIILIVTTLYLPYHFTFLLENKSILLLKFLSVPLICFHWFFLIFSVIYLSF